MRNEIILQKRFNLRRIPGGHVLLAMSALTTLAACERAAPPEPLAVTTPTAEAPAGPHAEFIPTQADLDRFKAEGPDPTLRKISAVDYWLHYRLMQATGIEKELGGEEQAIAALKSLGEEYERRMRVAEIETPKMIRATFTGEGMSSGFVGMGHGQFSGDHDGSISAPWSAECRMRTADLNKGRVEFGDKSGSRVSVRQDGSRRRRWSSRSTRTASTAK